MHDALIRWTLVLGVLAAGSWPSAQAQTDRAKLGALLTSPIKVERAASVSDVPITLQSGKLYLQASVNGAAGEFIFDTGSPTILDQAFADQLDLTIVGENTGRDANGNPVTMTIAVADTIVIGGVAFHDVPVMVQDFGGVPLGRCYLRNGVLGSELLPGSVWRIDVAAPSLTIASTPDDLPTLPDTETAPLLISGYPYPPLVPYAIGRFSDTALFDTGSAAEVALFSDIARDRAVRKLIDRRSLASGEGRLGVSAGGIGDVVALQRFALKSFQLGDYDLGRTQVQGRPVPPTLVGAGVLATHTVTLDYPNARFLMSRRTEAPPVSPRGDFGLMIVGEAVEVSQIYAGLAAEEAGLSLGDHVVAIDGEMLATSTAADRCETSLWLSNDFDATAVRVITIERNGERVDLQF